MHAIFEQTSIIAVKVRAKLPFEEDDTESY